MQAKLPHTRRDLIYSALVAGIREMLENVKAENGKAFTKAKMDEMRPLLKAGLMEEFKEHFSEAGVSKQDATALIAIAVDSEMAKYY